VHELTKEFAAYEAKITGWTKKDTYKYTQTSKQTNKQTEDRGRRTRSARKLLFSFIYLFIFVVVLFGWSFMPSFGAWDALDVFRFVSFPHA